MSEFELVSRAALEALAAGETVVQCTVVRARGSTPRHAGARMLVWPNGRIFGTIGGATLELRAIEEARKALAERRSRLVDYVFSTREGDDSVGLCGGAVDVHIEVLEPDPILLIIGAGHVALPLAEMGAAIGMRVWVMDDRAEFVTPERFPKAERLEVVQYEPESETLDPLPLRITPATYVVVATWGWDQPALAQVLATNPAYVGLVASNTKWRVIAERLMTQGISAEATARVRAPVGLDLGAETPPEIALSILGEILAVRRQTTGQPLASVKRAPATG